MNGGYTRRHQAAERVALRRWLHVKGLTPETYGQEPSDTEQLMKQVKAAGGDCGRIMFEARVNVDLARAVG